MNTSEDIKNQTIHANIQEWKVVLTLSGLAVLCVTSLVTNVTIIALFWAYRPLRKFTNFFIVSLAISDILIAITSMPLWAIYEMVYANLITFYNENVSIRTLALFDDNDSNSLVLHLNVLIQ